MGGLLSKLNACVKCPPPRPSLSGSSSSSGADQGQTMGVHSKQGPQPPEMDKHLQRLKAFNAGPELDSAAKTLLENHRHCSSENIKTKVLTKSGAGHKTPYFPNVVKVHTVCTGETFGSHKVLMDQVNQSKKLQVEETNQPGCDVVILFCPIVSRAGSDVEAAMTEVPADGKVILVLMHHTRDADYSTCGMIWTDRFPNIISAVHVLYHETVPGLLQCAHNKEAVRQLQEVLKDNSS